MVTEGLRIVVADDNEGCRELYSIWLGGDHDVETAVDGREALDLLGAEVDIVFLDRDMPGPSGTEVAREIAATPYDPHVVMVSSMDADFDIVEFPIDEYLQKPMQESDLRSAIDRYRRQQSYRAALDDYFALTSKLATLEAEKSESELQDSEEYSRLRVRIEEKRTEVEEILASTEADWKETFQSCIGEATRAGPPNV